jgi:hypothetical protein
MVRGVVTIGLNERFRRPALRPPLLSGREPVRPNGGGVNAEANGESVGGVERDAGGGPALDGAQSKSGSSGEFAVVGAGDGGDGGDGGERESVVAGHGLSPRLVAAGAACSRRRRAPVPVIGQGRP